VRPMRKGFAVLISLALTVSFAARPPRASAAVTNLLSNGTFEGGNLNGWNDVGSSSASTAQAHTGSWSVRFANSGMRVSVPTVVGRAYKITAWVKIVSETGSDWGGFSLSVTDTSLSPWQAFATSPLVTQSWANQAGHGNNWFKLAVTFTARQSNSLVGVGYSGGSGRQTVIHADDIMVFEKPAANAPPAITAASLSPTTFTGLPGTQNFSVAGDDEDGAIESLQWNFGDGAMSAAYAGARSVLVTGSYVATVKAVDDDGAEATRSFSWSATDNRFPALQVTSPASDATVSNPLLSMAGTASGNGVRVRISSDRDQVADAAGTSAWNANLVLKPGRNRVIAQAQDAAGRVTTVERAVRYVPSGALGVSNVQQDKSTVDRWDPLEITFQIDNSAAADTAFPYETPANLPPGLKGLEGVTVEGVFSADNWATVFRRPGFLRQPYQTAGNALVPNGPAVWTVRFAPPALGAWRYLIEVREAKGTAQSSERTFSVIAPADTENHGPVWRSATDRRYFEHADGTPFLGVGQGISFTNLANAVATFNTFGAGNQNFLRWWVTDLWGSAWWSWASRTLGYNGIVPNTGLTIDSAYGDGLASLRIDAANPISYQGVGFRAPMFTRGKNYIARIRWRTANITGPAQAGRPYGACVRFTDWPEPGQTHTLPLVVPHVNGSAPWHVGWSTFTATDTLFQGLNNINLALIFENATGGAAYIDEMAIHELNPDGTPGVQLLSHGKMNAHLYYDGATGANLDDILGEANRRHIFFKLNVSEKQEFLINHFGATGLPDPTGRSYNNGAGTPTHRLHHYYWRYLAARFGALRAVHSFEVTNEEAPGDGAHFNLTADLARQAQADGNPHMGNTSTWATLTQAAWNNHPELLFADFHAYIGATAWDVGVPQAQLADDTALIYQEYDMDARAAYTGANLKPVLWGEFGITPGGNSDYYDPRLTNDTQGVWLHKLLWARTGPGITTVLNWHNDPITTNNLHSVFGRWRRFMAGISLTNGRYVDAAAGSTNANIRVFGQKDTTGGRAHLWIDNRTHTWGNVVSAPGNVAAQSGTVTVNMGVGNAGYTLSWYDTRTGSVVSTETRAADGAGALSLPIGNLANDTAVRIVRTSGQPSDPPPAAPRNLRRR